MNKFQNALYRFMSGRYGSDQLNNFLLIFLGPILVIFIKGELKMINFYL